MPVRDQERVGQIQAVLHEKNLDALVLFHTDNILMASGMFPGSTHVVAVVTADGKVVVITPWWRSQFVEEESWADEIWTFDWCKGFQSVEPNPAILDFLKTAQKTLRLERIGYDAKMHHYNPTKLPSEYFTHEEIKSQLFEIFPAVQDATESINQLKSIKSSLEIEKLRITHKVAKAGVQAFYENARVGIKETDLAAEVNYSILKMAGHFGIRYTYCDPPQITSGSERTSIADTLSNHATEKLLKEGDLVMLEIGLHADGFWADMTRTLVVGGPKERHIQMHEAILEAQKQAIATYRPGKTTGAELCYAAWDAMRQAGLGDGITHFLGHGLGFAYHEDRPILGPGEKVLVQPGHVTSIEPGLYFRENGKTLGGIRVEDNVVWGKEEGQAEILSDFYRGLLTSME